MDFFLIPEQVGNVLKLEFPSLEAVPSYKVQV